MPGSIEQWKHVLGDSALLKRAQAIDASDASAIMVLRRDYSAQAVTVALTLVAARAKAVAKFGEFGATMIADLPGIEQASSAVVAGHKAARFKAFVGDGQIADLCCGLGGDSIAMCDAGLAVTAVDRDPLRAWMTKRNTAERAEAVCADVGDLALGGTAIHLDPARRDEGTGRRAWNLDNYQPGPTVIGRLLEDAPAAALKLSPGVDLEHLPWPGEVEFISERGRLVQAVLWTGGLAQAERRATRIDERGTHCIKGEPGSITLGQPDRYLYTIDPAVERAGLIGPLCKEVNAPAVHAKLGLLTSDRVIDSRWLTGFELIAQLPWRPKRVRQWLSANDGGLVEVKTRGKACDPDLEQRNLRNKGTTTYTVFVLRFDMKVKALICKRL